jgi:lipoate-protein ligase A
VPDAWRIEERDATAAELHAAWPAVERLPGDRAVAVCRPTGPAVVLGSTQSTDIVDTAAAAARGLDVVRRRSGGGAVLVSPGDPVWIDAWVPAGDPRWSADVTGAFGWLGQTWASALERLGVTGAVVQGAGPGACTRWSTLVCFGGVGAGEVTVGGRKVVGLSQRRNRAGAWFHSACILHWDPDPLLSVLDVGRDERAAASATLAGAVAGVADLVEPGVSGVPGTPVAAPVRATGLRLADRVVAAFLDSLP